MSYAYYRKFLQRCKNPVYCTVCHDTVLVKSFSEHVSNYHGISVKHACPWCLGQYTWLAKQKHLQGSHLSRCLQEYYKRNKTTIRKNYKRNSFECPIEPCRPEFDMTPMCPGRDRLGREPIDHPLAYEDVFLPKNESWWSSTQHPNRIAFQGTVELAAAIVKKYLVWQSEPVEFYHVMVRAMVLDPFFQYMKEIEGDAFLLPFWCWCDGNQYDETDKSHHRHMIAVARNKCLREKVWNRMETLEKGFKSKKMFKIKNWYHLANTIQYVSRSRGNCNRESNTSCHFYIATELPSRFPLIASLIADGLTMYLNKLTGRVDVWDFVDFCVSKNNKFVVPLRYIVRMFHKILPVHPHLKPVRIDKSESDCYLHLLHGFKLHFEWDISIPDWKKCQAKGGNHFFANMVDEEWCPVKEQQKDLQRIVSHKRKMKQQTDDIEMEMKRRKEEMERDMKESMNLEKNQLIQTYERLLKIEKDEKERLIVEKEQLRKEWMTEKEQLRKEWMIEKEQLRKESLAEKEQLRKELSKTNQKFINNLLEENRSLREQVAQLTIENNMLKQKVEMLSNQMTQLMRDNEKLVMENNILKQKLEMNQISPPFEIRKPD